MKEVTLLPGTHKGEEKIFIRFENSKILESATKRIKGVKWSELFKCWYVPLDSDNYRLVCQSLHSLALIKANFLREYLQKRQRVKSSDVPVSTQIETVESRKPGPLPTPETPQPSAAYRLKMVRKPVEYR